MNYDIITFGSATRDVYVLCRDFKIVEEKKFFGGKGIAISLGSKIEIDTIVFHTGGGGTNAAVTFKRQGFRVAWCGMVGKDNGGQEVVKLLRKIKIDTSFVSYTNKKPTNYSIILSSPDAPDRERTILVYHGASSELTSKEILWEKLHAKWFYLAPLSGGLAKIFGKVVYYASEKGIKIAVNPGSAQLKMSLVELRPILSKVDILFLNQEEAALLSRSSYRSDRDILKKLQNMCSGIVVVTKGPLGAVAAQNGKMYTAPILKTKVLDRTGAGDAFCSGFLCEFIRTQGNIISALQFAMANSAACISQLGAKEGLLRKGERWKKVPVRESLLSRSKI
jgi:sugar/nucleoside kinase (ribokinase family)